MAQRRSDGPSKYALALMKTGLDLTKGVKPPEELPDNIDLLLDEGTDQTAARVQYVSQLQIRGLFKEKKHPPILAKKWNIDEKKVKQIVAEADRNVRVYSATDQQATLVSLNDIGHRAIEEAFRQGNMLAVAQLLRVVGEHSLDKRQSKQDVGAEIRSLTDAELERKRLDLTARLIARLPPEQKQLMLSPAAPVQDAEFVDNTPEPAIPASPITQRILPEDKEDQVHDQTVPATGPSNSDAAPDCLDDGLPSRDEPIQ